VLRTHAQDQLAHLQQFRRLEQLQKRADAQAIKTNATIVSCTGPALVHYPDIRTRFLQKMVDSKSQRFSQTFFADFALSKVKGKEMAAGLFRMVSGEALDYTYTYEEMKYIVEGKFKLTDGTGQCTTVQTGDLVYFPMGAKVKFEVAAGHYALGCFTGQRRDGEAGSQIQDKAVAAAIALNPRFVVYPQIIQQPLPKMTDGPSQSNSQTYFKDFAVSSVPGKEMAAGLFRMLTGRALDYTYTYEEMKYVVEGKFIITDGTGQKVEAKAGDLLYFPKGCQVKFETPHYAVGCFTGQRKAGEA